MTISKKEMELRKEMGLRIKEAREIKSKRIGKKYTGQMLADDLNISRGSLGDIESGRRYPNSETLSKIAEKCEISLSFFDEILLSISDNKKTCSSTDHEEVNINTTSKECVNENIQTWSMDIDWHNKCVNIKLDEGCNGIIFTNKDFEDMKDLFDLLRLKEKGLF